jgi:hypothetical protein
MVHLSLLSSTLVRCPRLGAGRAGKHLRKLADGHPRKTMNTSRPMPPQTSGAIGTWPRNMT